MNALKQSIADDLIDEPKWARSYSKVRPLLEAMIRDGEIARVKPPNGRGRNMIALTQKGVDVYAKGRTVGTIGVAPEPKKPVKRGRPFDPDVARRREAKAKEIADRKAAQEAERAAQREVIAEWAANGGVLQDVPLDIGSTTIDRRWAEIKAELGWQAI